jgi:hypothetical protein
MEHFAFRLFFLTIAVFLVSAALDLRSSKAVPQTTYGHLRVLRPRCLGRI